MTSFGIDVSDCNASLQSSNASLRALRLQIAIDHHTAGRLDFAEQGYRDLLQEDTNDAEVLCLSGLLAQQKGHSEIALAHMRKAVNLKPDHGPFLIALANALRELAQFPESALFYERAVAVQPDDLSSWLNFGGVLQQLRRYADAVVCYREVIQRDPNQPIAHNDLGLALLALQEIDAAITHFQQAIKLKADYVEAYNNLGVICKNEKRYDGAAEWFHLALRYQPDCSKALFNLGTIYFVKKNHELAVKWYRKALEFDHELIEAHQNLASIFLDQGLLEEAQHHRDCAYSTRPVLIDSVSNPIKTVVILWDAGKGNVPIDFLWPKACYTRIVCMMEYVKDEHMQGLPPFDLVFNAIGDSDAMVRIEAAVERFRQTCNKPFLNIPSGIKRTARDQMSALFAEIDDVICPATLRSPTTAFKEYVLSSTVLRFPIIIRPGGSHGGDHLVKLNSDNELSAISLFNSTVYYASNYVDYRSPDGYFRKYRIAFVDRQPFPYHMAIGENWMIHYETADMMGQAWKREEELAFLENPRLVLGNRAMNAIEQIGKAMNLDFCGVDFTLLPDGRLLVFEANATMLIHPEDPKSILAYKNAYVQRIFEAFNYLVARVTG